MSGRSSRNKGSAAEREVRDILKEGLGIDISRTPRSGAWEHAKGDLYGVPGFNIEIKRQERTRIEEWYEQSVKDTSDGEIPLLVYRRSRQPWKVVISLDHFIGCMKSHIEWMEEKKNGKPIDLGGEVSPLAQQIIDIQKERIVELQNLFVDTYEKHDQTMKRLKDIKDKYETEKQYLATGAQ